MINNIIVYNILFAVTIQFNFTIQDNSTIQFNTKGRLVVTIPWRGVTGTYK